MEASFPLWSTSRLRSIQRYQTPVVGVEYVDSCVQNGGLLPINEYKLDTSSLSALSYDPLLCLPRTLPLTYQESKSTEVAERSNNQDQPMEYERPTLELDTGEGSGNVLKRFRIYTEMDKDLPMYPDHFEVAKYSIFQKINRNTWSVLELQSFKGKKRQQYRVVRYWKDDTDAQKGAVRDMLVYPSTSEDALEVYQTLAETLEESGLEPRTRIPTQALDLGSAPLQQLLLEETLKTGALSPDVGIFVELLWTEALGCLGTLLSVSADKLSLSDVSRVEGLLIQAQRKLREGNHAEVTALLGEVYSLLPHRQPSPCPSAKLISQKLDLCQLIRDILNVSEMTLGSPVPSSLGKYRALRCCIETVPPNSSEFQAVTGLLQDSEVNIQQIFRVSRSVEVQTFKSELGNLRPLLHCSRPSNFVGILSRGLLLPCVGVGHHGIERTDAGNLGSGIYFSSAMSTCLKYSKPCETNGSRLLLVCEVALGRCVEFHEKDPTLIQAPEGYDSVHAVRQTPSTHSEFEDDEFVVYSPDQVKLKYVVQFIRNGDQLTEFKPSIDTSAELCLPSADQVISMDGGIEFLKNRLEDVKAGLLDSSGQQLPLQAINVKCKLMDLLSQVIIFQTYTNQSNVPIEAKYVFPLDDTAAVCGFEAFINGKHVVGQVKEKEMARKEYREAIQKGHGAYLMDQDAPDVFTISVGNLPPGATVLIKVTFVSELIIRDGSIFFSLPGSVAPWQESAALNQTTQVTLEKVCVTGEAAIERTFTLDMSIEMPYEITNLQCITHKVKMKRTDCKAVVSVLPGEVIGPEGFQLSVSLSLVHLPRMWVEKHPEKDSQACMLVFYPDFDINPSSTSDEVVLLLDTSESMRGVTLCTAQGIALQVLKTLDPNTRINVICFGTDHSQAFLVAQPLVQVRQAAESFIKHLSPVGGSTELWRPLRALSLLPSSRGIRNLLLLSDGHIQNAGVSLQLLRDNAQHTRLFTCGLSQTANRHMLRALALAGSGAYEFFDTKTKHNWAEKVVCQVRRMASPGCSSVSVKWQRFNPIASPPVQAPKQLNALFNDCQTLVYGFVPHCTQATLLGNLSGQELQTMVSTSELQKTKGTFLHKLTARALIKDYEDGNLDSNEAEHEGKKSELKSFIIELSKEFSILSQFTSFIAVEERDSGQTGEGFTDIPKVISEEDVDFLPYISWISPQNNNVKEEWECLQSSMGEDFCGVEADMSPTEFFDDDPEFVFGSRTLVKMKKVFFSSPEEFTVDKQREYHDLDSTVSPISFESDIDELVPLTMSLPPPLPAAVPQSMSLLHSDLAVVPESVALSCPLPLLGSPPLPPPPVIRRSYCMSPPEGASFESDELPVIHRSVRMVDDLCEWMIDKPHVNDSVTPLWRTESHHTWNQESYASPVFGSLHRSQRACLTDLVIKSDAKKVPRRNKKLMTRSRGRPASQEPKLKWAEIFQMQHSDGYWELSTQLGSLINFNKDVFVNVFLKQKGIQSLGGRVQADILRLVATLLVLQLMRIKQLEEGKLLRTLFCLEDSSQCRPPQWESVKRAVDWVCWADREYPCVYSRLEFGYSWESSTRQLLGYENLPHYSPLRGVNLKMPANECPWPL
ncbi:protein mono-ADP-ribosyltransferase PARP4 isoform 2-T2 [Aulostomus maculatus]